MHLRKSDFADLQAFVDLQKALFAEHNLTLHSSTDMEAFEHYLSGEKESWGAGASHHPAHSYLNPSNCLWVYLERNDTKEIVASSANKLVQTENFLEAVFSHRLYDTQTPVIDCRIPEFQPGVSEEDFESISGNIAYAGGMYVRPDHRGKGLVELGPVSRTIAIRHFPADCVVGIHRLTKSSYYHATERQHFTHCKPFVKGMPYKWDGDFQIAWSNQFEWLASIRQVLTDAGLRTQEPSHSPGDQIAAEAIANTRA